MLAIVVANSGLDERQEFEYIRHGTLRGIASWDVTTGQVRVPYLAPTRKETDFANHITELIASIPEIWVDFHC